MGEQDQFRGKRLHFVTGKLARHALADQVARLADKFGFEYSIGVMPITVAALMTPRWLLRHLDVPVDTDLVILPGYCRDPEGQLVEAIPCKLQIGPKDLRDLPILFGQQRRRDLDAHRIEIIAEINHAPQMTIDQIVRAADRLRCDGADRIDIGCDPDTRWADVGTAVAELVGDGHAVSIDSFDPVEVEAACRAGATLVLSVNSDNRDAAVAWGAEVVAIPDTPRELETLYQTIDALAAHDVPLRLDPILEPIGLGFYDSLVRYHTVRSRYPDAAMMMGIGNITELADVDSAGVNLVLLGLCEELGIGSVLTTEVINWARTSVKECAVARRLVHFAVQNQVPPKNLDPALVMLRDARLNAYPLDVLQKLAEEIRDNNFRLFVADGQLHLIARGLHLSGTDPFELFSALQQTEQGDAVDASHAFYLGFELAKALTALTLGKNYEQDEALDWGMLTRPEKHRRLDRRK